MIEVFFKPFLLLNNKNQINHVSDNLIVSYQLSVGSYQLGVVSWQLSVVSYQANDICYPVAEVLEAWWLRSS